jgi:hypothetical protein
MFSYIFIPNRIIGIIYFININFTLTTLLLNYHSWSFLLKFIIKFIYKVIKYEEKLNFISKLFISKI